jgi:hypothetical protein
MVFFLEITNVWQKSQDFWFTDFFLEIFKIHYSSCVSPVELTDGRGGEEPNYTMARKLGPL